MKQRLFQVLGRLFVAGLLGWMVLPPVAHAEAPAPGRAAPRSEAELLQRLEAAVKAKDKAAILALYNWDGVAD